MPFPIVDPIDRYLEHLFLPGGWAWYLLARLIFAMIAGGLVGLERELRGRSAGFRTHLLVCLGSALVMIVSVSFATARWAAPDPNITIRLDPSRIAYGIMMGIGFLGGGLIVHSGASVRGLTTAAALWCVAAIGMTAGFGLYVLAVMATILVLAGLWLLDYVEACLPKLRHRRVVIRRPWQAGCVEQTIDRFKNARLWVSDATFLRSADLKSVDVTVRVGFRDKSRFYALEKDLERDSDYELISTTSDE